MKDRGVEIERLKTDPQYALQFLAQVDKKELVDYEILHALSKLDDKEVARKVLKIARFWIPLTRLLSDTTHQDDKYKSKTLYEDFYIKSFKDTSYEDIFYELIQLSNNQKNVSMIARIILHYAKTNQQFREQLEKDTMHVPVLLEHAPIIAKILELQNFEVQKIYFEPRDVKEKTIKQELGLGDSMRDEERDILEIGIFLSDSQSVIKQLKKLEDMLIQIAKDKGLYDETIRGVKYDQNQPTKTHKILSSCLYKIANDNQFLITLVDRDLQEQEFYEMLESGELFKDKKFGGSFHGEWTHLIQWCCIMLAYKDKELKLAKPPHEIFTWLGKEKKGALWDRTFEVPKKMKKNDFRDVQGFNEFLLSNECSYECHVLNQLIKRRAQKRDVASQSAMFPGQTKKAEMFAADTANKTTQSKKNSPKV